MVASKSKLKEAEEKKEGLYLDDMKDMQFSRLIFCDRKKN